MPLLTVEHTNRDAVSNRLRNISQIQNSDAVMTAVGNRMDQYYSNILQVTPVRTGYLKSTIAIRKGKDVVQISASAYYAAIVDRRRHYFFANLVGASLDIIQIIRATYGMKA